MATRRYMVNPQDATSQVTEAAGSAVASKYIEVTVDWDGLIAAGLSGQQARLQVISALYRVEEYIEQSGKFNVNA